MANIGRLIAVIAAVILVLATAVFFLFKQSLFSEGLFRVETAVGLDTAPLERHIVPGDFCGWAVVHYAVEGTPPLREEDGALIVEYPADGRLETSTPAPDDGQLLHRTYSRRTSSGQVPLSRAGDIWGEYGHVIVGDDPANTVSRSSGFFVGTMAEFRASEWPPAHAEAEETQD